MYPAKQTAPTHPSLPEHLKKDDKQSTNSGTEDSGFFSGQNLSADIIDSYDEPPRNVVQVTTPSLQAAPQQPLTSNKDEDSGVSLDITGQSSSNMNELCSKMCDLDVRQKELQEPIDIGQTVYHCIVGQRNLEMMYGFLRDFCGYGLDFQNDLGRTALHDAVETNQPLMVQCLIKAGADPQIRDYEGNTPLHIACMNGATDCAKELLYHRLYSAQDIEQWNYNGQRCVHLAVDSSNVEILQCLIQAGANINSREGKAGFTPLHIAVEARNYSVLQFLLKNCPMLHIDQVTYAGITAYQLAVMLGESSMQEELISSGAEQLCPPSSDSEEDDDTDSDEQIPSFYRANAFGSNFTGLPAINIA